jgi:hypothetical protein
MGELPMFQIALLLAACLAAVLWISAAKLLLTAEA